MPATGYDAGQWKAQFVGKTPLHAKVMERYQSAAKLRKKLELEWELNVNFFRGNQYAVVSHGKLLAKSPTSDKRERFVYNKSAVACETVAAFLLKNGPIWSATATRGDGKSQAGARLARQLGYYYWNQLDLEDDFEEAIFWELTCGAAFWEVGWNPDGGELMAVQVPDPSYEPPPPTVDPMTGEPMPPPPPPMVTEERMTGDVYVEVRSPAECFIDPGARKLKKAQWAIILTRVPTGELRRQFPGMEKEIIDDEPDVEATGARAMLEDHGAETSLFAPTDSVGRCTKFELWERPSPEFPDGLHVVATRNLVLSATPTPPGYAHIPLAMLRDRPTPGRFWPDAMMRNMVPLNKIANRMANRMVRQADGARNRFLAPEGALDETQLTNEDNELVEYQLGGPKPDFLPAPPIPSATIDTFKVANQAMEDESGATPAAQGRAEGEVRSGRQVAYLQEGTENRQVLRSKHVAKFLTDAMRLVLKLVEANVTEPRLASIVGKGRMTQVRQFKGSDLAGCTDIVCEPGSLMGFSRAQRYDKALEMFKAQIINREEFLEALDLEDHYQILEDVILDKNNALEEEEGWTQGQPCAPPRHYEDHRIHLASHNNFRKGPEYRVILDDAGRAMVDEHCTVHEDYVNAMEAEAAEPEEPGEPGMGPSDQPPVAPGQPPSQAETAAGEAQSGQERAEGLPPVPAVDRTGPGAS